MTRSDRPIRLFTRHAAMLWAACLLWGAGGAPARADGPKLTASFGIAGRYRPGGWLPVHVAVQNPAGDTLAGQIQVRQDANPNGQNGQPPAGAVFARPISAGAGASAYQVCVRGLTPAQDNLTVQFVEGRERGDGRALAQINTQNPATSQAFSGTPLTSQDPFLVGFGGDPGAFTFLNAAKLGLAHTPGGLVPDPALNAPINPNHNPTRAGTGATGPNLTGPAAVAQVAEAAAADLPDRMAAYGGVDAVLLRSDAPLDALTVAQADALRGWVAGGGHLIVCGGADPSRLATPFFEGLLPAAVGPARTLTLPGGPAVSALALTPKPLPGVHVLVSVPGGGPLVVVGPFGAGSVTLTAYDPTGAASLASPTQSRALWRTLLTSGQALPSSLLSHVAAREENYGGSVYYGNAPSLLSEAVMRGPSLDAPGTEVIGLFLLAYLIMLVPVNYLVLKRLDRKEMAWVTIPALVLLFAAGTFGVGYAAKGGSLFLNRAAIVETSAGQRGAGVYAELGLFSPRRTDYDLTVSGGDVLAAIPNPGQNYSGRFGGSGGDESQGYGATRFVQTPAGASLLGASVNMWAMRAFDVQSTADLGGSFDARLTPGVGGSALAGTITNHTGRALTGCRLLYRGQSANLGDLAPNAALPVSGVSGQSGGQGLMLSAGEPYSADDAQAPVGARMRAALSEYAQSLTRPPDNNYYNAYGSQAPVPPYAPAPGEALLVGWSDDPSLAGPAPRVDGRAVKENDVSLVIIHLPVAGG